MFLSFIVFFMMNISHGFTSLFFFHLPTPCPPQTNLNKLLKKIMLFRKGIFSDTLEEIKILL